MKTVFIEAASVSLAGKNDWQAAKNFLVGGECVEPETKVVFKPQLLPPNERRRASESVKLAFSVCEPLFDGDEKGSELRTVFASSGGDYLIFDKVCRTLNTESREVSPTLFHNSVHNAPAGYWHIAAKEHSASTSIAASNYTVGMGMLEAFCQLGYNRVLLACYDICPVSPLNQVRPIRYSLGFGLVLSGEKTERSIASIQYELKSERKDEQATIEHACPLASNPISQGLPIIKALMVNEESTVQLSCSNDSQLVLKVNRIAES